VGVSEPKEERTVKKKIIILSLLLLPLVILWHYIWYDSARRYVHAELADQFIALRTEEYSVVSKAIDDLGQGDIEMANKRLQVLSNIYTEDLTGLEQSLSTQGGIFESFVISRENMESLRQFVAKYSLSIEVTDESH
jgi:hypothetical protein